MTVTWRRRTWAICKQILHMTVKMRSSRRSESCLIFLLLTQQEVRNSRASRWILARMSPTLRRTLIRQSRRIVLTRKRAQAMYLVNSRLRRGRRWPITDSMSKENSKKSKLIPSQARLSRTCDHLTQQKNGPRLWQRVMLVGKASYAVWRGSLRRVRPRVAADSRRE